MKYYTIAEIIAETGKSKSTIKRIIKEYGIQCAETDGRTNKYSESDYEKIKAHFDGKNPQQPEESEPAAPEAPVINEADEIEKLKRENAELKQKNAEYEARNRMLTEAVSSMAENIAAMRRDLQKALPAPEEDREQEPAAEEAPEKETGATDDSETTQQKRQTAGERIRAAWAALRGKSSDN